MTNLRRNRDTRRDVAYPGTAEVGQQLAGLLGHSREADHLLVALLLAIEPALLSAPLGMIAGGRHLRWLAEVLARPTMVPRYDSLLSDAGWPREADASLARLARLAGADGSNSPEGVLTTLSSARGHERRCEPGVALAESLAYWLDSSAAPSLSSPWTHRRALHVAALLKAVVHRWGDTVGAETSRLEDTADAAYRRRLLIAVPSTLIAAPAAASAAATVVVQTARVELACLGDPKYAEAFTPDTAGLTATSRSPIPQIVVEFVVPRLIDRRRQAHEAGEDVAWAHDVGVSLNRFDVHITRQSLDGWTVEDVWIEGPDGSGVVKEIRPSDLAVGDRIRITLKMIAPTGVSVAVTNVNQGWSLPAEVDTGGSLDGEASVFVSSGGGGRYQPTRYLPAETFAVWAWLGANGTPIGDVRPLAASRMLEDPNRPRGKVSADVGYPVGPGFSIAPYYIRARSFPEIARSVLGW